MTENGKERKPLLRSSPRDTNSYHSSYGFYDSIENSDFQENVKTPSFLGNHDLALKKSHSLPFSRNGGDIPKVIQSDNGELYPNKLTSSSLPSHISSATPRCASSLSHSYINDNSSLSRQNSYNLNKYGNANAFAFKSENDLRNQNSVYNELENSDLKNNNNSQSDLMCIPSLNSELKNSDVTIDHRLTSSDVYGNLSALVVNGTSCHKTLASTAKPDSQQSSDSVVPSVSESTTDEKEAGVEKWPFFLINISLLFINCAGRFHSLVMDQYMYQDSARTLLGNSSVKTSSHPCLNDSGTNSSMTSLMSQVESLTSQRLLHLDLTSYGAGIFSNIILGSYSTVLSRKLQLLIPTFGYLVRNVTIPVVIHWDLDINWLFLGYGVDGLCGNASGIYFGSFLYTTDVTPRNRKRTLGMAILMAGKGTVTAILNVATGHLIESTGFFIPAAISAGCVLSSILIVLLLPNRKPHSLVETKDSNKWSLARALTTLSQPFRKGHDGRVRQMVVLGCLAFLVTLTSHFGIAKIRVLFFMNLPFCWKASVIGWFLFGREFACRTFVVIAVAAFHRCLPGVTLGILGALSYLGGMIMYTLADMSYDLYCGPLFASFAVLESVSYAVGSLYLLVYKTSLTFFPRLVFVIGAGLSAMVVIWMVWFQVLWRRHTSKNQFSYSIVVDTPANATSSSPPGASNSINS